MNIGVFSFIIGLIGIFLFSFILCPIALILGIIAIIQKNNILWGVLRIVCAIIGALTSPILMGLFGLGMIFGL